MSAVPSREKICNRVRRAPGTQIVLHRNIGAQDHRRDQRMKQRQRDPAEQRRQHESGDRLP
ncbi:hypothetical protein [Croceicoccus sp. YJ47]|uniref:hypothetical protein n=1 Tax=Croceicoccus sp. YJ47 TaxID=2798724 RepID=UPI001F384A3C|nr:hypothetical protein [Croceicoccus sp. YJ47]